jgi:hypothetical protein
MPAVGGPVRTLVAILLALACLAVIPAGADATTRSAPAARPVCDPIDPSDCLLPFPNDWFTVRDRHTPTGRRVHIPTAAMPRNSQDTPIDPTEWNRNDGFSPGSAILTHVPGLDLAETSAAPITDIGRSLRPDAPIVLLDARTLGRHPYWAELDATTSSPSQQALIVRPARNLHEGARYIVALRRMRDRSGRVIPPGPAFAAFLHGRGAPRRRAHMRGIFATLRRAGIPTGGLYLAWDFTVASTQGLTGRMVHIRDAAFRSLQGGAPRFRVTKVERFTPDQNPDIARRISGTFDVPSFLDEPGGPAGSRFNYRGSEDGLPTRLPGNTQVAPFECQIPRSATVAHPARPSLYGHGLFNDATEVEAGNVEDMANEHRFAFCGTDWLGLTGADADVREVAHVFTDLSDFAALPDRLQQGMLDALFLGRLLVHPEGFASASAFRSSGHPLLDPHAPLVYDGNSLGGIMGGALTAVAQDYRRAVLGVPGMNFSTLLDRSRDFPTGLLDAFYPDPIDQQLVLALSQMLWDRADADGYAAHMIHDPLPGTPPHRVLLHVAFGDQQVANITSDVEARTVGARVHAPVLRPGRSLDVRVAWAIPRIDGRRFTGSAMVVWDSGSPPPPTTNTPPTAGVDPHEDPRASPAARWQKAEFLEHGVVVDVCGGRACVIPHA